MNSQGADNRPYDILYVGEQTAHVVRLIRGMADRGLRPAVLNGTRLVQTLSQEAGLSVAHVRCPAVRWPGRYRFPWVRRFEALTYCRRLRRVLSRLRPRVVHINGAYPEHEVFAHLGDCPPMVLTCWGTDVNAGLAHGPPSRRRAVVRLVEKARVLTADSREMLQRVRSTARSPNLDLRMILWGIDADLFTQVETSATTAWREELQIPERAAVILAPRRIDPRYSPERVLRAFAASRTAAAGGHLVFKLFGDNPEREQRQRSLLEEQARDLGVAQRVRFARPCRYDELPGLYHLADCAVFLLSRDGCPSTAFELMSAGVPLIAGQVAGYDGLLHHEDNVLLVNPQDTPAAARLIDRITDNPAGLKSQLDRARAWVAAHASHAAMIDAFMDAYETAAARPATTAQQEPKPKPKPKPKPELESELTPEPEPRPEPESGPEPESEQEQEQLACGTGDA